MEGQGKTIAIIGASTNPQKYGNIAVKAWRDQGYTVYPVNPNVEEVEGLKSYPSILDIPGQVDIASVYLPPQQGVHVMESIARKGVALVYLNPGADDDEVVQRAKELGLNAVQACSIVAVGRSPSEYR